MRRYQLEKRDLWYKHLGREEESRCLLLHGHVSAGCLNNLGDLKRIWYRIPQRIRSLDSRHDTWFFVSQDAWLQQSIGILSDQPLFLRVTGTSFGLWLYRPIIWCEGRKYITVGLFLRGQYTNHKLQSPKKYSETIWNSNFSFEDRFKIKSVPCYCKSVCVHCHSIVLCVVTYCRNKPLFEPHVLCLLIGTVK